MVSTRAAKLNVACAPRFHQDVMRSSPYSKEYVGSRAFSLFLMSTGGVFISPFLGVRRKRKIVKCPPLVLWKEDSLRHRARVQCPPLILMLLGGTGLRSEIWLCSQGVRNGMSSLSQVLERLYLARDLSQRAHQICVLFMLVWS